MLTGTLWTEQGLKPAQKRVQQYIECHGGTLNVKKRRSSDFLSFHFITIGIVRQETGDAYPLDTRSSWDRAGLHQILALIFVIPGQLVAQTFGHTVPPPSAPGFLQPPDVTLR
jgi:hypothetical protein